ncbi:MAG: Hsp70 family protein, partial [Anaerolineae bacterium]|nr:Hsp70 family protein [Anaerolineae bacterium]
MNKIIGIDLGTTNTVAAVVEGGEPRIIPTHTNSAMLRSVVAIASDGRWLVGQTAHNQAIANPTNTVYAIKRLMGRQFDDEDVQELHQRNRYSQITRGADGRAMVRLAGQDYRPEQIAAMILREVKANAERYLGAEVRDAVISLPPNAEAAQRQATLLAGEIAGLNVRQLIHEPTAIGLAYGVTNQRHGLIAVYDMGGGTFNVSFMRLREGELEVLRAASRPFLGGDDFDHLIQTWIVEEFERAHHIPLNAPPEIDRYLRDTAENLKIALSHQGSVPVHLPFIGGQYSLDLVLSREALEQRVDDLVQESLDYCKFLRDELNLDRKDFDAVLLAGGMSRMPYIQRQVMTHFAQEPQIINHPEQAVALGAALHGGIISGEIRDVLLLDITPLTLSIRKEGGLCEPFIPRNTTIPASEVKTVTTAADNQT